ncbi:DUF3313 domain-containing protein [Bradyrhizobium sp. LHD-71]|uniref:DUF3313 domain-containing protein n=1 Tax=Bradyrhizobium sp. LHD-71 TaxID=3072141 RepID=UPI00280DB7B4|nr:DUF3313 domain-containing protein [Bradyrhizobium sp. LHD-71]MDQ8729350.1 DUF3313 domain-containing protein [Bradyrhizobium sp. LHD-71]
MPTRRHAGLRLGPARAVLALAIVSLLPACASAPLVQGRTLSSYGGLAPSDGMLTKSHIHVNKPFVQEAKTVRIVPASFTATAAPKLTDRQRALVANAINRALCVSLSDRFTVVAPELPADLTVRAVVTQATETDEVAAGLSAAVSIGTKFVDMGAPVPIPRIPIGLGNLSLEAEAIDQFGQQQAAMLWGRGATALFSSPKASKASDAYDLAAAFGDDFGYLLVKGESPFKKTTPSIPSLQKINSAVGLAPKYAACESYGRAPGLVGVVGDRLGLPPEWTDKGAKKNEAAAGN